MRTTFGARPSSSSIAKTLTLIATLVSGVALLLASLAFGAYDRTTFRAAVVRNLSIQAQITGANSVTALMFNDPPTAEVTLEALRAAPNVVSADIYTPDGHRFAAFRRDKDSPPPAPPAIAGNQVEAFHFDEDQIALARKIVFEGKHVGSVSIRSDLQELNTRRSQYIGMVILTLIASLITALLMSWILQRSISGPVIDLAAIAKRISTEKDYTVRATGGGKTREIGVLTEAFNEMLTQIEQRDHSLRDAQNALEERVQQRTAELDAVNKELEAFSYSVSHDLRAPLRHVSGFAALLEQHASDQLDAQSRKYLETIAAAAKRMGRLIDDLLAFSRTGRSQLVKRRISLNDLVRDVREEVVSENGAGSRAIEWKVDNLPDVDADPAMLRQVIANLLSNAVKYTSSRPAACIEIGVNGRTNDETVVFVRDNGVGFDMQYAHKLFGVFQRLHSSDEFEGTGIGLANVQRIIHRHGGRVWAESELGRGATFYFSVPDAPASPTGEPGRG